LPGSGDGAVRLEDYIRSLIKGSQKSGSSKAIARFIARKGIVTRRELLMWFKSNPISVTITRLKKLGLVYSCRPRKGRDGFVVSIPWLLYLDEIGVDWKSMVMDKVPRVSTGELSELEGVLQKAKVGPLGDYVRMLVGLRRFKDFQEEQSERVIDVIPRECSYPSSGQWRSVDEYYTECVSWLLGFIQWVLSLLPFIVSYPCSTTSKCLEEIAKDLREQAKELDKGTTSAEWVIRLHARTLLVLARLLSRAAMLNKERPNAGRALREHFDKILDELKKKGKKYERDNMRTVLNPFIAATVGKILEGVLAPHP